MPSTVHAPPDLFRIDEASRTTAVETCDPKRRLAALDSEDIVCLLPGEPAMSGALLPGEDPTVESMQDMEHWIRIYSELLDYKRFLLKEAAAQAGELQTDVARREIETAGLGVFKAEAEGLSRRLSFWHGRLDTLKAAELNTPR